MIFNYRRSKVPKYDPDVPEKFSVAGVRCNWHIQAARDVIKTRDSRSRDPSRFVSNSITYLQNHTTHIGGTSMKLKYDSYDKVSVGKGAKKYTMIQVKGTQIGGKGDGEERNPRFFPSNKDMYEAVKEADKDDILDITLTKNGDYWNPTAITNDTKEGKDAPSEPKTSQPTTRGEKPMDKTQLRMEAVRAATRILVNTNNISEVIGGAEEIIDYWENGMPDTEDLKVPDAEDDLNDGLDIEDDDA